MPPRFIVISEFNFNLFTLPTIDYPSTPTVHVYTGVATLYPLRGTCALMMNLEQKYLSKYEKL